jgi:hypothetical protein
MKPIEFADGAVQIDASIVAEGLGIALPRLKEGMRRGTITSLSERGVDASEEKQSEHHGHCQVSYRRARDWPSAGSLRICAGIA